MGAYATSIATSVCRAYIRMSFSATRILSSAKSTSSKSWLARQCHDAYVKKRSVNSFISFRARSGFKLLELDVQWKFFKPDVRALVDLGAAPGGWSQVAAVKLGWISENDPEDELDDPYANFPLVEDCSPRAKNEATEVCCSRPIPIPYFLIR